MSMHLSLPYNELQCYVAKQLEHYYPDQYAMRGDDVDQAFSAALERLEYSFSRTTLRGYSNGRGTASFSHLHSDQYSQFLYYFANSLWTLSQNKPICDKLIGLNKALNGCFFSYKCKLPDVFLLAHPVGSIIGNAGYSDFLVISQNVTINTGTEQGPDCLPKLGKGLFLGAGAKIIGQEPIGDRVSIGVDAVVYNQAIPDDKVVERTPSGEIVVRNRKAERCKAQIYFNVEIE
nr:hypothetical protein [uncultured Oscillibacter sp.]